MSTGLGTLFVDEQPLPITHIYLEAGQIMLRSDVRGPLVIPKNSEVRIHDPEGGLVAVAPWRNGAVNLRDADWTATILLPVHINEVAGWPPNK